MVSKCSYVSQALGQFILKGKRARLVGAEGFFGHRIAGDGKGAGARTTAHPTEFAQTAAPFKLMGVAQGLEQRRIAVNVNQRLLFNIAHPNRHKTAGEYVAQVGDKNKTIAGVDVHGRAFDSFARRKPFFGHYLLQSFF